MRTFFRILGHIVYIPLALLFIFELYRTGIIVFHSYILYKWFGIGFAAYIILGIFFRKNRKWLQTFSHELTHTLVGMLFFRKIHSFTAERGEGVMSYSVNRYHIGDLMISLSPYFLPIFTFFFLIIRHAISGEAMYIFDAITGFTFAFHLGCFISQTGNYQTDISQHGYFYSYLIIATFLSLNISLVLLSIESNLFPAIRDFAVTAWMDLKTVYGFLSEHVSAIISNWTAK